MPYKYLYLYLSGLAKMSELKEKRKSTTKTEVYYRSINECGKSLSIFEEYLKDEDGKLFAM